MLKRVLHIVTSGLQSVNVCTQYTHFVRSVVIMAVAVKNGRRVPMFQTNVLPLSSTLKMEAVCSLL
jgi:hypothetical protein